MIGRALGSDIERYAAEVRAKNPLFARAANGTLSVRTVGAYLANIHHLIQYTPEYLGRARDRARAAGDEALALHYDHKGREEVGHDKWAERDLERVGHIAAAPIPRGTVPAIRSLVHYLAELIDEDPVLYLSYCLFAEYLIVILGPEWLDMLEKNCGIPTSAMTVVANHVELDKDHVEEALEAIDDLVGDPTKLPKMRDALHASFAYFEQFCRELEAKEFEDERAAAEGRHGSHVSAA